MQTDQFAPPTADVQDLTTGSVRERPPRPISVWILQAVLAICVLLFLYGMLHAMWSLVTHERVLVSTGAALLGVAWRLALVAAVVTLIVWLHRGQHVARWLGLAAIAAIGVLSLWGPDTTEYANEAERTGGTVGRYIFMPALYLWWAYAAVFSGKAKAYFSRDGEAA